MKYSNEEFVIRIMKKYERKTTEWMELPPQQKKLAFGEIENYKFM